MKSALVPIGGASIYISLMINEAELAADLYQRRKEGIVVPLVENDGPFQPEHHQCHKNADLWVLNNPGHRAVRGWLVFDFNYTSCGLIPFVQLQAHWVVESPDGTLLDITPSLASQRYPFVRHPGSEEGFVDLVEGQIVTLYHQPA